MMKRKRKSKAKATDYVIAFILVLFAAIVIYPFYNALLTSVVSETEYIRTPFLLYPKKLDFSAYKYIIEDGRLFSGMAVTVFVTVVGSAYNMLLTTLCAYALTKPFPGRKFVTYMIIFTVYFTGGLIPYYLVVKQVGLIDSVFSMILPLGVTFMYMTVIRRYFEELPASLLEAAKIDGASEMTILWKVVIPLSKPILATFLLYYSVDRWNEWWNGMLFIRDVDKQPLQLILRTIVQDATSDSGNAAGVVLFGDGIKMASTMFSMLPIMLIYPFLQKYFVGGMTVGAVKE